jgi:hypothetical protein
MEKENKILEILDLVREKVLSPDEVLLYILLLFNVNKQSSCCNASIDTDEQSCEICSNCGERL